MFYDKKGRRRYITRSESANYGSSPSAGYDSGYLRSKYITGSSDYTTGSSLRTPYLNRSHTFDVADYANDNSMSSRYSSYDTGRTATRGTGRAYDTSSYSSSSRGTDPLVPSRSKLRSDGSSSSSRKASESVSERNGSSRLWTDSSTSVSSSARKPKDGLTERNGSRYPRQGSTDSKDSDKGSDRYNWRAKIKEYSTEQDGGTGSGTRKRSTVTPPKETLSSRLRAARNSKSSSSKSEENAAPEVKQSSFLSSRRRQAESIKSTTGGADVSKSSRVSPPSSDTIENAGSRSTRGSRGTSSNYDKLTKSRTGSSSYSSVDSVNGDSKDRVSSSSASYRSAAQRNKSKTVPEIGEQNGEVLSSSTTKTYTDNRKSTTATGKLDRKSQESDSSSDTVKNDKRITADSESHEEKKSGERKRPTTATAAHNTQDEENSQKRETQTETSTTEKLAVTEDDKPALYDVESRAERISRYKEERRKQLAAASAKYGQETTSSSEPEAGFQPSYLRYSKRWKKEKEESKEEKPAEKPEMVDREGTTDTRPDENQNVKVAVSSNTESISTKSEKAKHTTESLVESRKEIIGRRRADDKSKSFIFETQDDDYSRKSLDKEDKIGKEEAKMAEKQKKNILSEQETVKRKNSKDKEEIKTEQQKKISVSEQDTLQRSSIYDNIPPSPSFTEKQKQITDRESASSKSESCTRKTSQDKDGYSVKPLPNPEDKEKVMEEVSLPLKKKSVTDQDSNRGFGKTSLDHNRDGTSKTSSLERKQDKSKSWMSSLERKREESKASQNDISLHKSAASVRKLSTEREAKQDIKVDKTGKESKIQSDTTSSSETVATSGRILSNKSAPFKSSNESAKTEDVPNKIPEVSKDKNITDTQKPATTKGEKILSENTISSDNRLKTDDTETKWGTQQRKIEDLQKKPELKQDEKSDNVPSVGSQRDGDKEKKVNTRKDKSDKRKSDLNKSEDSVSDLSRRGSDDNEAKPRRRVTNQQSRSNRNKTQPVTTEELLQAESITEEKKAELVENTIGKLARDLSLGRPSPERDEERDSSQPKKIVTGKKDVHVSDLVKKKKVPTATLR